MKEKPAIQSTTKTPNLTGVIVKWRAVTHRGSVCSQNEDAHWVAQTVETKTTTESASRYLFAIADGLGANGGGAIASRMALKSIKEEFYRWQGDAADRLVERALQLANQNVYCVARSDPELFPNVQTTLTIVVLEQDSLTIGHVGDCRLYRLRNSSIELLTRDHTKAHDLLHLHHISQEQLSQHPGRHQHTRSIGNDIFVKTDIIREKMLPGDTYLLCSDGVWSTLTREQIQETMQQNTIHSACEQLVMSALQSGGPDNITAIVFRIEMIGSCAAPPFSLRKFILKR